MTSDPGAPDQSRTATVARASGAIVGQGIQALTSLLLQVAAAQLLGPADYGLYMIVVGLLITLSAVQGGLYDSAVVLERHDRSLHGTIVALQYTAVVVASAAATAIGLRWGLLDGTEALLLGLMVALWILEESGRRRLLADLRSWALVANDAMYATAALGTLGVLLAAGVGPSIAVFVVATCCGSLVAFLLAVAQLPKGTFRAAVAHVSAGRARAVLRFAAWRSAHELLRPLSMTLARVIVVATLSAAALGRLEAARLLVAPAQVLISGAGAFLLPFFARELSQPRDVLRHRLHLATAAMIGATAAVAVPALVLAEPLQELIVGDGYDVNRAAVAGWALFALAWAAGVPAGSLAIARRQARAIFWLRVVDNVVGLVLAAVLVSRFSATTVPFAMAAGASLGFALVWRLQATNHRTSEPEPSVAEGAMRTAPLAIGGR